jgi:hypothetical protein
MLLHFWTRFKNSITRICMIVFRWVLPFRIYFCHIIWPSIAMIQIQMIYIIIMYNIWYLRTNKLIKIFISCDISKSHVYFIYTKIFRNVCSGGGDTFRVILTSSSFFHIPYVVNISSNFRIKAGCKSGRLDSASRRGVNPYLFCCLNSFLSCFTLMPLLVRA